MDIAKQPPGSFLRGRDNELPAGERKVPDAIVGEDKIRVLVVEDDPDISRNNFV